jgi:hypothetical protein
MEEESGLTGRGMSSGEWEEGKRETETETETETQRIERQRDRGSGVGRERKWGRDVKDEKKGCE